MVNFNIHTEQNRDAELWIPAVNWHFIPWLKGGFDFGPKVLKQQMGHGIKMWSHKYSVENPSRRERQMQPPRKYRYQGFQQVPIQWVGYYRLPRSPLCHAALPWHSDEGFLSWFRVLMIVRAYPCFCTVLHLSSYLTDLGRSPCPPALITPLGRYPSHILQHWGVQTTSCHHSHNGHNTEAENWEEWTYFLFISCNLVQLNPNIKNIFKQQSYWE